MTEPNYATIVANLSRAGVPLRELGSKARAAVTLAAGRIIAAAFSEDDENLFWSNPQLLASDFAKLRLEELAGGLGGDRLWFAPEVHYHWDGKPDWSTMQNYKVPAETDPGSYRFADGAADEICLLGGGVLSEHGHGHRVPFEVSRRVRLTEPPIAKEALESQSVDFLGIETSHRLRIPDDIKIGRLGLWHLVQLPVGSVLVVPLAERGRDCATPQDYALPGNWQVHVDHLSWAFKGQAKAKLGLAASAITGRAGALRPVTNKKWCMIVREFPADPAALYVDHPYGMPRSDQVLQAWDGLGFGELEFHSPGLDAEFGRTEYEGVDRLWAFAGSSECTVLLAQQLLGVDVRYIVNA